MKDVTANQSEHKETLFKCAIVNVFCLLYVCFVLIFLLHIVSVFFFYFTKHWYCYFMHSELFTLLKG